MMANANVKDIGTNSMEKLSEIPVHNSFVNSIVQTAVQHDLDRTLILDPPGIDPAHLSEDNFDYTYGDIIKLINWIMGLKDIPALGIKTGLSCPIDRQGLIGYALVSSRTLRKAIGIHKKYLGLSGSVAIPHVIEKDNLCYYRLTWSYMTPPELTRYFIEDILGACVSGLSNMLGFEPTLQEVNFALPEPDNRQMYSDLLGCPVNFNRNFHELVFDSKWLDYPLVMANDMINKFCLQQCKELQKRLQRSGNIRDLVSKVIIFSEQETNHIEDVARRLGMGYRSLQRALEKEGVTFSEVYQELRMDTALAYLSNSDISTKSLAYMLGYSETSSFSRAFRSWAGVTPNEYRADHGQERQRLLVP